jgi:hypothetical protein
MISALQLIPLRRPGSLVSRSMFVVYTFRSGFIHMLWAFGQRGDPSDRADELLARQGVDRDDGGQSYPDLVQAGLVDVHLRLRRGGLGNIDQVLPLEDLDAVGQRAFRSSRPNPPRELVA